MYINRSVSWKKCESLWCDRFGVSWSWISYNVIVEPIWSQSHRNILCREPTKSNVFIRSMSSRFETSNLINILLFSFSLSLIYPPSPGPQLFRAWWASSAGYLSRPLKWWPLNAGGMPMSPRTAVPPPIPHPTAVQYLLPLSLSKNIKYCCSDWKHQESVNLRYASEQTLYITDRQNMQRVEAKTFCVTSMVPSSGVLNISECPVTQCPKWCLFAVVR